MIVFKFRVNHSFLAYPAHPITVPRSQVDYDQVQNVLSAQDEAWVHLPNIGAYRGLMYHGRAGYGPYYQVRLLEPVRMVLTGLDVGELVEVLIFQAEGRVEVHVRRPPHNQQPTAA
jgi:hypothetical protein